MAKDKSVSAKVGFYKLQRKKHPGITDVELKAKYVAKLAAEADAKSKLDEEASAKKRVRDEAEAKRVEGEKAAVERKKEAEEVKLAEELANAKTTETTTPVSSPVSAVVVESVLTPTPSLPVGVVSNVTTLSPSMH